MATHASILAQVLGASKPTSAWEAQGPRGACVQIVLGKMLGGYGGGEEKGRNKTRKQGPLPSVSEELLGSHWRQQCICPKISIYFYLAGKRMVYELLCSSVQFSHSVMSNSVTP